MININLNYILVIAFFAIYGYRSNDMHGKTLFVYTDGINEAENANKEQFGDNRLQALLQQDLGSRHSSNNRTVAERAAWAPMTNTCAISAVFDGPLIKVPYP